MRSLRLKIAVIITINYNTRAAAEFATARANIQHGNPPCFTALSASVVRL